MSKWSVGGLWIDNPQLYPAVDERGCAPDFAYYDHKLWDERKGPKVLIFNALSERTFNLTLRLEGTESEEDFRSTNSAVSHGNRGLPTLDQIRSQERRGLIVKAFAEKRDGSWEEVALTTSTGFFSFQTVGKPSINFEFKDVDFKRIHSYRPANEPWAFVGRLRFELTIVSTPGGMALDGTGYDGRGFNVREYHVLDKPNIEFYAICPALPTFLRHEGVPIDLLRFALGPQHKRAVYEPASLSYLPAITHRVFESGFIYERSHGSYSFTAGARHSDTTQLSKFLRIWRILIKSAPESDMKRYGAQYEKNPPTVNCMDQTGILGICMSLACIDEDDRNTLGAYFIKPFGFLHETGLVGYAKDANGKSVACNNPFMKTFKKVPELSLAPTDENRSYFGSHVFLEFRHRIYDACAGPVDGDRDLKIYLTRGIDRTPGTYPTTFRDSEKGERVTDVDISKYTANPDNPSSIKPTPIADRHGALLGEVHDLMLKGHDWWIVPEELNHELDDKNFSLDIPDLGSMLRSEFEDFEKGGINWVDEPQTDTGATVIERGAADHGVVTWSLEAYDSTVTGLVELRLSIYPSFEHAAAARSGMYAGGDPELGPNRNKLATEQVVSGQISERSHATAIAGRFLIDAQSEDLGESLLVTLVTKVRELSLKKGNALWVGNELADGFAARQGQPKRHHVIETKVDQWSSYLVQVEHCLDVDWSYSTGNVFLLDYESGERSAMEKKYWVYNEKFSQDEGEKTITSAYRFKFYARRPGEETVRLVFYDRTYDKPQYRFIDFKIAPK